MPMLGAWGLLGLRVPEGKSPIQVVFLGTAAPSQIISFRAVSCSERGGSGARSLSPPHPPVFPKCQGLPGVKAGTKGAVSWCRGHDGVGKGQCLSGSFQPLLLFLCPCFQCESCCSFIAVINSCGAAWEFMEIRECFQGESGAEI